MSVSGTRRNRRSSLTGQGVKFDENGQADKAQKVDWDELRRRDEHEPPIRGGTLVPTVTNYLASDVVPLLHEGRYRDSVRGELSAAVAELNQLAGWMAYDVGDSDSGRRHLRNAMHLCRDVRDDALAGEMLAGMSHQAAFQRSAALATDLARAAKDNAKRAGMPALVAESAVIQAHGLALMSDAHGWLGRPA